MESTLHQPTNPVRFVTAASLFDGHDASINIMRRILQAQGVEVIHLGHNRSVDDVVRAAVQEDVQGVAVSSYQGGHMEYFTYLLDRLREQGRSDIRIYGGGGGVIVPSEIEDLHQRGVARIFSPQDGQQIHPQRRRPRRRGQGLATSRAATPIPVYLPQHLPLSLIHI